jgi:hypothetical protein
MRIGELCRLAGSTRAPTAIGGAVAQSSSTGGIGRAPHQVNRLTIEISAPYQDFRARYEKAVPRFDTERFNRFVTDRAGWDTIDQATRANAPHGFIIYWSQDFSPLMGLAGNRLPCVGYLMGNHVTAEKMYRHDPAIVLYAPLRTAILTDAEGGTRFVIDQPSTAFASFGNPDIAKVGFDLDQELAALLAYLDAPVPAELNPGRAR